MLKKEWICLRRGAETIRAGRLPPLSSSSSSSPPMENIRNPSGEKELPRGL